MERLIKIKDAKAKKEIMKAFGIKGSALSQALNFYRSDGNDVKIRIAAMKSGGKLLCEVKEWNYELLK